MAAERSQRSDTPQRNDRTDGGRSFITENLSDLPIAAKIGAELRDQYVLEYRPSRKEHDARWRKIKVKLRTPKAIPPLTA